MFKLVVLLLSNLALIDSANISQECRSLFEANDPTDCWNAPKFQLITKDQKQCSPSCALEDKNGKCCFFECQNKTGFIVAKHDKKNFLKIFEDNFDEKKRMEKEAWMPEISKSYDYCESLYDTVNGTTICDMPNYVFKMDNCMKQQNFLNCPKELFRASERCEAAKKFVATQDTCGDKYEDIFVIDFDFFYLGEEKISICSHQFLENKPSRCTQVPSLLITKTTRENCDGKCKEDDDKECCSYKCQHEMFVIGDEIQKDKVVEGFKNFIIRNDEKSLETWQPVIEKAFDVCNPIVSEVKTKSWCNLPDKIGEIVFCMKEEMFLNVPTTLMKNAADCKKLQNFVKKHTLCGKKYGDVFIIDHNYWTL